MQNEQNTNAPLDFTPAHTQDALLHISLLGGQARALLAETPALCDAARRIGSLSRTATAALGRHMTAALMLAATLKGERDSLTAYVKGGGPLGTVLAVARPDGTVKGYVDNSAADPPRKNGKLDVGAAVGRDGELTVIKDMGMREPYVGRVRLRSGEIAEDWAAYFSVSEQTPALVSLGVLTGDQVLSAGGLIVEMMPGADEAAVRSVEMSAPMFTNISKTLMEDHLEGAVTQLLSHLQPQILERKPLAWKCDCSRERVERALISMGRHELEDMIAQQQGAEVDCHFCKRRQRFTRADLEALLEACTRP